jgi:hypothetical protein
VHALQLLLLISQLCPMLLLLRLLRLLRLLLRQSSLAMGRTCVRARRQVEDKLHVLQL